MDNKITIKITLTAEQWKVVNKIAMPSGRKTKSGRVRWVIGEYLRIKKE